MKMANVYNKNFQVPQKLIYSETLGVIENVAFISYLELFRKLSRNVDMCRSSGSFPNDWYEYVEYGTTNNPLIFFNKVVFHRVIKIYRTTV